MHDTESVRVQVTIFYAPVLAILGAAWFDVLGVRIRSSMSYTSGVTGRRKMQHPYSRYVQRSHLLPTDKTDGRASRRTAKVGVATVGLIGLTSFGFHQVLALWV